MEENGGVEVDDVEVEGRRISSGSVDAVEVEVEVEVEESRSEDGGFVLFGVGSRSRGGGVFVDVDVERGRRGEDPGKREGTPATSRTGEPADE